MKRHITLLLTLIAGIVIGAAAVPGLHAQAKLKAYTVAESVVLDNAALAPYSAAVAPVIGLAVVAHSILPEAGPSE